MVIPLQNRRSSPGFCIGKLLLAMGIGGMGLNLGCANVQHQHESYVPTQYPSNFSPQQVNQAPVYIPAESPPPQIPSNYTSEPKPALAEVELNRWWVAFQNGSLNQALVLASQSALHPHNSMVRELHAPERRTAETAMAFFNRVLAQKKTELLQQQLLVAGRVLFETDKRYQAGEVGRADSLLAQAEIDRIQASFHEVQKSWVVCDQQLRSLVGFQQNLDSILLPSDLNLDQPLLIDVGQPARLLEKHSNGIAPADRYQKRFDQTYAEVNALLGSIEPGLQEIATLAQAEKNLRQAHDLTLDQYILDRVNIADLLQVQTRWFDTATKLLTAQHRHVSDHVTLYSIVGGGGAPTRLGVPSKQHHPGEFPHQPSAAYPPYQSYTLGEPLDITAGISPIHLLPPVEKTDELRNGTVTVVSLGNPTTRDADPSP